MCTHYIREDPMNKNMVLALLLSCFALHGLAAEDEELMDCNEDELGFTQNGNCRAGNDYITAKRQLDAEYKKLIEVFRDESSVGPSYGMAKTVIESLKSSWYQYIADSCSYSLLLDMTAVGISGEQNSCMAEEIRKQVVNVQGDRRYWQIFMHDPKGADEALAPFLNNKYGPSFSCQQASSQQEKLICSDDTLRALDSALNYLYLAAKLKHEDEVQAAQRQWVTKTRNQCDNSACLIAAYRSRISVLASQ